MKAIHTKYHGTANMRGSRITASAGSNRITLSWDDALDADENHDAAALALCEKMRWTNSPLMRGTLENRAGASLGNVYTFDDRLNRLPIPRKLYLQDHPPSREKSPATVAGARLRTRSIRPTRTARFGT